jgi:hypothetical protein
MQADVLIVVTGIILIILSVGLFAYAIPRRGRVAGFVGSAWEPYAAIFIIAGFVLGILIAGAAIVDLLDPNGA